LRYSLVLPESLADEKAHPSGRYRRLTTIATSVAVRITPDCRCHSGQHFGNFHFVRGLSGFGFPVPSLGSHLPMSPALFRGRSRSTSFASFAS